MSHSSIRQLILISNLASLDTALGRHVLTVTLAEAESYLKVRSLVSVWMVAKKIL